MNDCDDEFSLTIYIKLGATPKWYCARKMLPCGNIWALFTLWRCSVDLPVECWRVTCRG